MGSFEKIVLGVGLVLFVILISLLVYIRRKIVQQHKMQKEKVFLETENNQWKESYEMAMAENDGLSIRFEELKKIEERNKKMAYVDYLTNLPNRTAYTEKLEHVILTLRKEESVAVMYIDMDNFKVINDRLGHSYGDELLIDVTERLKQVLEEDDYLARFGGDEFAILTQNIEDMGMHEEKVKKVQKIFSYPFSLAGSEFFVTTSIGICFIPKDGKSVQSILKNVDSAMYGAKKMGKNTYLFYDESLNNERMEQMELQSELRDAIEKDEFVVYYQPQMDLLYKQIIGFEALIRWMHPSRGLIEPDVFIPLAEDTGLILAIGKKVLFAACKQLKAWEREGFSNIKVSVNLSDRQFRDLDLLPMVQEVIEETGITFSGLELEITESVFLKDINYSIETIQKLKDLGISISLDQFGRKCTSFNSFEYGSIDQVKIDKSVIHTILQSNSKQIITSAIIALAHNLKIGIVAMGVETDQEALFLKENQCDIVQGYLYSEPVMKKEAENLLKDSYEKQVGYLKSDLPKN